MKILSWRASLIYSLVILLMTAVNLTCQRVLSGSTRLMCIDFRHSSLNMMQRKLEQRL